jgi:hypothetical protein
VLVDQKPADVSADRDKRQLADQHPIRASRGSTASVADKSETDPVCGMIVNPARRRILICW